MRVLFFFFFVSENKKDLEKIAMIAIGSFATGLCVIESFDKARWKLNVWLRRKWRYFPSGRCWVTHTCGRQSRHRSWVWETASASAIALIKLATAVAIPHPGHVLCYVTMSTYCAPGDMLDTVATTMSKAGIFAAFWVGGVGSQVPWWLRNKLSMQMDHCCVQNVQMPWECTARTPERLPLHQLSFLLLFHLGRN